MKFAKIFICTILMFAILSVPCFATNEGTYGHYISPGTYIFDETLDFSMFTENYTYNGTFSFVSKDIMFNQLYIYYGNELVTMQLAYFGDVNVNIYTGAVSDFLWNDQDYRTIEVLDGFYIYDSSMYLWWVSNVTRVDAGYDSSFFDEVVSIFTFVGQWISGAAEDLTVMFWADNSLTFVGTLAVASLAMAVSFLIIGLISRFLRFRG